MCSKSMMWCVVTSSAVDCVVNLPLRQKVSKLQSTFLSCMTLKLKGFHQPASILREFIEKSKESLALEDRLHTVWQVFYPVFRVLSSIRTPTAGGRVMQAREEQFLRLA